MIAIGVIYGALTGNIEAVSYTHLDVYKRQGEGGAYITGQVISVDGGMAIWIIFNPAGAGGWEQIWAEE